MNDEGIGAAVLDAAGAVHRALGPGRREMNYEAALAAELARRGLQLERQVPPPDGCQDFQADFVVGQRVAVVLYAVEPVTPAHEVRLRRYLRSCGFRLGFVVDFSEEYIGNGITAVRAGAM